MTPEPNPPSGSSVASMRAIAGSTHTRRPSAGHARVRVPGALILVAPRAMLCFGGGSLTRARAHWQGIDFGLQLHIYRCVGACVGLYVLRLHVCLCPCTNTANKPSAEERRGEGTLGGVGVPHHQALVGPVLSEPAAAGRKSLL